ncbi:MAG: hypothetical protein M3Q58_01525 [Bacteroidota bacterium]|nr:hypothetical protein [Bacteroidota bacterium]
MKHILLIIILLLKLQSFGQTNLIHNSGFETRYLGSDPNAPDKMGQIQIDYGGLKQDDIYLTEWRSEVDM